MNEVDTTMVQFFKFDVINKFYPLKQVRNKLGLEHHEKDSTRETRKK